MTTIAVDDSAGASLVAAVNSAQLGGAWARGARRRRAGPGMVA